jgi:ribosomal protein L14E/L6E/L27E
MISDIRKNRFRSGAATEDVPDDSKKVQNKVTGTMIGRIVQSVAGRDADRLYVIVAELDGEHVAIADGRLRKCVNPKKKKLKHLKLISFAGMECVEKIADGVCNDSYIRRVLSAFRGETDENESR